MKSHLLPTPKDLSLTEIMERFAPDEAERATDPDRKAREYLEAIRWPGGPTCPHCKNAEPNKIWKLVANKAKKIRPGLYHCAECKKQFGVMVKTIFTDSHIPLRTWLVAWYLICNAKKGVSALQIQRALNLGSYRTAWMMMHKIRHALKDPAFSEPLSGTLEVDETFIGPNPKPNRKGYRKGSSKVPVAVLVQRGGQIRTKVIPSVTPKNLKLFVGLNASPSAVINSDQSMVYRSLLRAWKHNVVNHSRKEYARRNKDGSSAHVNTCESFFSLLKRGITGSFHCVSPEHLPRYCDEFAFRWNNRKVSDGERLVAGLKRVEGKVLTYKQPVC